MVASIQQLAWRECRLEMRGMRISGNMHKHQIYSSKQTDTRPTSQRKIGRIHRENAEIRHACKIYKIDII